MPVDKKLVEFITEARKRGYTDSEIRKPLIERDWTDVEIDIALRESYKVKPVREKKSGKEKIEIYLSKDTYELIRKRAKKNLLSVPEQIEDIVRRSCINAKLKPINANEKIDDLLVGIFSRKKTGRKPA
jgi:hypothetical protein